MNVDAEAAYPVADIVILAVPDNLVGRIAGGFAGKLKPGARLVSLDAAAPHAGQMPDRSDIAIFATHPCHPSIFRNDVGDAAQGDYFGGVAASQDIVCALMRGSEEDYELCEDIAKTIFAPVNKAHRTTVEQMAILEPALSETVGATLALALRDATEEAIRRGVPREAALAFVTGHLGVELAIAFDQYEGTFSDGALLGAWVSICWWGDRLVDRWRCCLGVFTGVGPRVCGCLRRECGYEEQLF